MNKMRTLLTSFFLIILAGCLSVSGLKNDTDPKLLYYTPKIKVESLRLYTAGDKGLEKSYRVYNTSFRNRSVDRIWYELIVSKIAGRDSVMAFKEIWLDDNSKVILKTAKELSVNSKDRFMEYSAGISNEWKPGYYVLKLYQDSLEIAKKEFKITD
jgi:uncharacterized membrane protein